MMGDRGREWLKGAFWIAAPATLFAVVILF
jgi:hypothetical protein